MLDEGTGEAAVTIGFLQVRQPVDLQLLVTQGGPYCADMVRTLFFVATLHPLLSAQVLELSTFARPGPTKIPSLLIDGVVRIIGAVDPEEVVSAVNLGARSQRWRPGGHRCQRLLPVADSGPSGG